MQNHATRAWKIQSRMFVRRKKVGIFILASGYVVVLVLKHAPATFFLRRIRDFEKEAGPSNWLARRFFINLHSLAVAVAWE
jgi:hypothetical protein